ncbi:pilus assembly protein PilM [Candidatus Gracilibacteria bacterium]|nr:pilus assembly protein PilM [Candidatus Gracilibacteria bacterium]
MSFTTKHIKAKTLCIIDIGSYKLRACATKFKNQKIDILGYVEKRQDSSYFSNHECTNLPGLCQNIIEVIQKLEAQITLPLDEIVVNYPFGELFLGSKKINYKRKHAGKGITLTELEEIMESVEKLCLKKLTGDVERLYGLNSSDIQILLSRVNAISIDGENHQKIIGKEGTNIRISLLNAFVPESKHKLMLQIGKVIHKKIFRILPSEYCLTRIFSQKNIVVVNLGATQTTVSVVRDQEILGISKISIGIQDLVNKISRNTGKTQAEIIDILGEDCFELEKKAFLSVWGESFGLTLGEILGKYVCPKVFYLGGGGGGNAFIRSYLEDFNFSNFDLKITGTPNFVREDMSPIFHHMKHIRVEDIERIPLDMYVMLIELNHIITREGDAVSNSLKTAIKKLGYLKS